MIQADSVLSTPPTNTSVLTEDPPFTALAVALSPQWGDTVLRLTTATDRLASRFDKFIGAEKQDDTVKACRHLADELIRFLDEISDCDEDAAADDEPCDDRELEFSLGSFDRMTDQSKSWLQRAEFSGDHDVERDDCDAEREEPEEACEDEGIQDSGIGDADGLMEQIGSMHSGMTVEG